MCIVAAAKLRIIRRIDGIAKANECAVRLRGNRTRQPLSTAGYDLLQV